MFKVKFQNWTSQNRRLSKKKQSLHTIRVLDSRVDDLFRYNSKFS